ncbi:MAG: hypothetical protein IKJ65_06965 [Clostridia bacterium]|nr:hypothetical protein [Clostridia bacterium]
MFLAFLLSRILILLIGQIGFMLEGKTTHLYDYREFIFSQWDAPHYIGIAENGYVNEGDARLHIVFYPLYPFLVRLINLITGKSFLSSAILSNFCLLAGGVFLYLLTFDAYGAKIARASVLLFMFSMGAVFFSIPYTESLFFLLTVSCVYFARKRRFYLAILLGALSSLTRLPGAITAVCVFFEMIRSRLGYIRRIGEENTRLKRAFIVSGEAFFKCLFILLGFCAYLIINKAVTGDAFKFLEYQKNHWGQEAGNLYKTCEYSIRYLFYPFEKWYQMGVYLPQCAAILFSVLVLFFSKKAAHPSDLAYAVVYVFVTLSPTMLISGPRYISAMYPLYPLAAVIMNKNRVSRILIIIVWALFFVYSSYMFLVKWTYL